MDAPFAEIEVILAGTATLGAIGVKNFTVRINDRAILTAICQSLGLPDELHSKALIELDKLDKIGVDGVLKELTLLGVSSDSLYSILSSINAGKVDLLTFIDDFKLKVDPDIINNLQATLKIAGQFVNVIFDPTLVRGMGYYTGIVFEIAHPEYSFSLGGGGRYDNMIGRFLNRKIPACGFSLGFERLMLALTDEDIYHGTKPTKTAIIYERIENVQLAYQRADFERQKNNIVSIFPMEKKLGRQIERLRSADFVQIFILDQKGEIRLAD
jgi:histidyl-tRNA synthetase